MEYKKTKQTKEKQTHRLREQIGGYQKGRDWKKGEVSEGDQLYGDGW